MEPRYDIKEVEARIYEKWEKSGLFAPEACVAEGVAAPDAEPFSIVLPPPNVTGELHMGHAAMLAVEDIMVRYARMQGKRTLWIPGTDHAAIATQSRVEKIISKEEDKSRHELGREEFLRRVREYAATSRDTIVRQIKRMGASLDWSREAYTLDATREHAVRTAFETLYDLGLIYRGMRVVNWDPKGQTVISDDEIVYEERRAKLYTFRYAKDFPIAISTTRPETKVGDTAVAVHPDDARYAEFVGKEYEVNFCGVPLLIKVIADTSVDRTFGTGALGVTPAHSTIDAEIALRHKLPSMQVIDERARMKITAAPENALNGLKVLEAREKIIEALRADGLIEKEEEVAQNVATAERTGGIIEPLPKLQWFIAVDKPFAVPDGRGEKKTLKELMRDAVESGGIAIAPERFEKIYENWIANLHDWCISRQIWFGHRVPVWYCLACGEPRVNAKVANRWFFVRHGQTESNKQKRMLGETDVPLNDEGRAEIRAAAEKLKGEQIGLIITSDMARAHETAEIIAQATGAEIVTDKNLRERFHGKLEGMLREEAEAAFGDLYDYEANIGDGESYKELEERVWNTFLAHKKDHAGKNVLIVSHGGVIRMLIKKIKNLAPDDALRRESIRNGEILSFDLLETPCAKCGHDLAEQDPDTLDTWFSSGLWPFSTLGWPSQSAEVQRDLATYFPNAVLETGYDIIFFWVARMILMSSALMGDVPFRRVYLHGLVRDAQGRKMSKSLNNGIDPLEMADKYGADATRLSLIIGAAAGNDIKLSEDRIRGYRNFSTKLWNIARFIDMNRPAGVSNADHMKLAAERLEIKNIKMLKVEVTQHIEDFEFHLAAEKLYHYVWHTLADEIIEEHKKNMTPESWALLEHLLLESLKMLHPFMPFVTEEIHGIFRPGKMLMVEKW